MTQLQYYMDVHAELIKTISVYVIVISTSLLGGYLYTLFYFKRVIKKKKKKFDSMIESIGWDADQQSYSKTLLRLFCEDLFK